MKTHVLGAVSRTKTILLLAATFGFIVSLLVGPSSRQQSEHLQSDSAEKVSAREGMLQPAPTATPSIENCEECGWYRVQVHVTAEERDRTQYPKVFLQQLDWHHVMTTTTKVIPIRFLAKWCQSVTLQGACVAVNGRIDEDGVLSPVDNDDFPDPACSQNCAPGVPCELIELFAPSDNNNLSYPCYDGEEIASSPCFRDTDHHIAIAKQISGSGWNFAGISFTQDPVADDPGLFTQATHLSPQQTPNCETDDEFVMTARAPLTISSSVFDQEEECSSHFYAHVCFANWFIE